MKKEVQYLKPGDIFDSGNSSMFGSGSHYSIVISIVLSKKIPGCLILSFSNQDICTDNICQCRRGKDIDTTKIKIELFVNDFEVELK